MKIAVISPHVGNLRDMSAALTRLSHQVATFEGGKARMRPISEQEAPDLMLVEGMCCDVGELAQVEQVIQQNPQMAVVLLCPTHTPEFLIQAMRTGVREVLPSPVSAKALEDMADRIEAKINTASRKQRGKVLAFVPSKGGSGATFLATNLGYHLSESSSVLLIDLNLQFGDALATLHDGPPAATLADLAQGIARLDSSLLAASSVSISSNFSILAAPEDPAQSVEIKPEHIDAILSLASNHYDFVLLDLPRTIDPVGIRALDRAHRIFIVLQQSLPAVRHAAQLTAAYQGLGYPSSRLELLVNRYDKMAAIGIPEITRSIGSYPIHTVPNSFKEVRASIEQGTALAKVARGNAVTRTLLELSRSLQPPQELRGGGLLRRILRRA